nr:glutamate decarboxylase [Micromonospora sp. DSM 115978]
GPFELVSDGSGIPAFAFRLRPDVERYTVFAVSELLRSRGWLVPAYRFPADLDDLAVLRVVVRNGFSRDLAELLLADLDRTWRRLSEPGVSLPAEEAQVTSFHH